MRTLFQTATDLLYKMRNERGLSISFVEDRINELTNFELLEIISNYLEEKENQS